ncbi:MAG: hypothetical protein ACOYN0_14735 [Phycisphaerales bacterium]
MDKLPDAIGDAAVAPIGVPPQAVCLTCGYSLAGLSPESNCPECRTPISRSIVGGGIIASGAQYVRTLRRGASVVLASVVADVAWLIGTGALIAIAESGSSFGDTAAVLRLSHAAGAAATLLGLWGWWMLTAEDPGLGARRDLRWRKTMRALLVFGVVGLGIQIVVRYVPALSQTGFGVLSANNVIINSNTQWDGGMILGLTLRALLALAWLARLAVALLYLRALASAIPDQALRKRCSRMLWYIPVMCTVGWAIVIGVPLAVYAYVRTLWLFRRRFGEIERTNSLTTPT